MPRNYSVKQTIQMLKNGETKLMKNDVKAKKNVELENVETTNEILRFNHPDNKKSDKKWYQFWK